MTNHFDFPILGYGAGLRPPHYSYILNNKPDIDWFEIITENYIDVAGYPLRMLEEILEHYPVVMHGVSLSIGTIDPLNSDYLQKVKTLIKKINPAWVSDHLCWTGIAHKNTHDLLPVPYTEEALAHIIDRIKRVQDILDRPLVLENPSTYLEFSSSSMPEWEFIARMAEGADCALLLDANNVYVSCYNHRWDPKTYIDALPLERVAQIHLAGHTNKGTHIVDTHDDHVIDEVWHLYAYIIGQANREINTMVEWDDKIPDFPIVLEEVSKARHWGQQKDQNLILPTFSSFRRNKDNDEGHYTAQLQTMQNAILDGDADKAEPESWIVPKPDFTPSDQLGVYIHGYRYRLFDTISSNYPALETYLGKKHFNRLLDQYIEDTPSSHFDISRYPHLFPDFVKKHEDEFSAELSLLEKHLSALFHAEESAPLTQDDIGHLTPETFMEATLQGRKALILLPFAWQVNAYFNDVRDKITPLPAPEKKPSYLALYRHDENMWRLDLEEHEYLLLSGLFSGLPVGEAINAVLPANENNIEEKLSTWFGRWMNNGLLSAVS